MTTESSAAKRGTTFTERCREAGRTMSLNQDQDSMAFRKAL
ncbi:hypothetical protein SynBMKMC1_01706 [Synechococcus sp. BMK-MC-1]|nr:hypothetical protein SynBMKMC1_01706 [Synechococcus sp. BMK-MC-1]